MYSLVAKNGQNVIVFYITEICNVYVLLYKKIIIYIYIYIYIYYMTYAVM